LFLSVFALILAYLSISVLLLFCKLSYSV